jgi:hypothetical protein
VHQGGDLVERAAELLGASDELQAFEVGAGVAAIAVNVQLTARDARPPANSAVERRRGCTL